MKGIGASLMLILLLASVLAFTYWFRTPHPFGTRWIAASIAVLSKLVLVDEHVTH